jgi:competence ComEA-like helix-hairpin-helix protein
MAKRNVFNRLQRCFEVFDFSQSEQRGIIVLVVILLILTGIRVALSYVQPSEAIAEEHSRAIHQFLCLQQQYHDSVSAAGKQRHFHSGTPQEWKKYPSSRTLTPFVFNPDTMEFVHWKKMGFTEKEAQQIVNYQAKGGKFYQKSDFKKLYCVSEEDYRLLEAYIEISLGRKTGKKEETTTTVSYTKQNINTINNIQIQKISSIEQKIAQRIVNYREKLGGFVHINQLKEVYGMDSNCFLRLKDYFYTDGTNIKKLNINELGIKELSQHPYIDYYIAKSIVTYRQQHGKYNSVEDVKKAVHFYDELYKKIVPYLGVE